MRSGRDHWHLLATTKLRITDSTIEEVGGPVIRMETTFAVKELATYGCPGIKVRGRRNYPWLPAYRIWIPSALPELEEIKQMALSWEAQNKTCKWSSIS